MPKLELRSSGTRNWPGRTVRVTTLSFIFSRSDIALARCPSCIDLDEQFFRLLEHATDFDFIGGDVTFSSHPAPRAVSFAVM